MADAGQSHLFNAASLESQYDSDRYDDFIGDAAMSSDPDYVPIESVEPAFADSQRCRSAATKRPVAHSAIEKHRRDRINNLVEQLGRLVEPVDAEWAGAKRPKHAILADTVFRYRQLQAENARLRRRLAAAGLLSSSSSPAAAEGLACSPPLPPPVPAQVVAPPASMAAAATPAATAAADSSCCPAPAASDAASEPTGETVCTATLPSAVSAAAPSPPASPEAQPCIASSPPAIAASPSGPRPPVPGLAMVDAVSSPLRLPAVFTACSGAYCPALPLPDSAPYASCAAPASAGASAAASAATFVGASAGASAGASRSSSAGKVTASGQAHAASPVGPGTPSLGQDQVGEQGASGGDGSSGGQLDEDLLAGLFADADDAAVEEAVAAIADDGEAMPPPPSAATVPAEAAAAACAAPASCPAVKAEPGASMSLPSHCMPPPPPPCRPPSPGPAAAPAGPPPPPEPAPSAPQSWRVRVVCPPRGDLVALACSALSHTGAALLKVNVASATDGRMALEVDVTCPASSVPDIHTAIHRALRRKAKAEAEAPAEAPAEAAEAEAAGEEGQAEEEGDGAPRKRARTEELPLVWRAAE